MKLLVIGGSYFYGRVFVMEAAKEHDVTVWNRGTYSMADFGVRQIQGDRHEQTAACEEDWDAVIDFCAYAPEDVRNTVENMTGKIGQYVLISTVDAYERDSGVVKNENFCGGGRGIHRGQGGRRAGACGALCGKRDSLYRAPSGNPLWPL